ncbi:MAG: 2,3-bisphosphoglycerate-independent phosphoglycerate mutase [Solirubrobacterales bacterium]|nr:2,3-bisphosphoglycerate-independent phosphoglycerate mutase [Solirubrobacterales bacterium]
MAERESVPGVALIVLDGWGLAPPGPGNAVELADTPVFDALWAKYPHATLRTSGRDVGLPEGQMGNSEVGHLNLGAGAIVHQDLTRIDIAIEDGSFAKNPALLDACAKAKISGRLHLMGLVSDGGVHSSLEHVKALLDLAASQDVPDVVVHAFTDGRDTLPRSADKFIAELEDALPTNSRIGTVIGRYFAMDRDKRWDRVKLAYDALVHGRSDQPPAATGSAAVAAAYARDENDEFIKPTIVGEREGTVRSGDAIICFNFRPDRMREIVAAFGEKTFKTYDGDGFDRGDAPEDLEIVTMTEYHGGWPYFVAYPPDRPSVTLASTIAAAGGTQLHVAETEKYPHVTYFFNGGEEKPNTGEQREMAQSPKEVATYDLKPEMSAAKAADLFVAGWTTGDHKFGVINFANPDMVGHSGVIPAVVKAVEETDAQLGRVVEAVTAKGGVCLITADHGNAEQQLEPDGSPNTAHTLNPVPFIVIDNRVQLREQGILADVTPTVLDLLGIDQPGEMSGLTMIASD